MVPDRGDRGRSPYSQHYSKKAMIYRSRILVTMDGPPIEDGAVVVRAEFIVAAGRWADIRLAFPREEITDLGEAVLLPGLINAHCHLDYSNLRHAILPPSSFTEWISRINAIKRSLDPDDYLAAIERGFGELRRWGTTTVLNIESFPELMWKMPAPPLRTWWFYEMIDVRQPVPTEELVAGALLFFQEKRPGWLGGMGLSPHAPFTASPELYRLCRDYALRQRVPWTTHLGESDDERAMFIEGRGPLHTFLSSLGRPMMDCGQGRSALAQLTAAGALGPECIAVHLNELEQEDFALLGPDGPLAGMTIAHCPRSHRYFKHREFPAERLHGQGVNLCVATDSPASDGSFSLLDELRAFAGAHPQFTPLELLAMVTVNPARALGLEGRLGCVRAGAWADLAAFPTVAKSLGNIYAEVVGCRSPVSWMMVHGKML
jgi:cytosine/adenosine deaminase-related metal-dependent hydrolase